MSDDKIVTFPGNTGSSPFNKNLPAIVPEGEPDVMHQSGQAICGACHHEWTALAPVGVVHLDCPKCSRRWGTFKNAIEPEYSWRCDCGEQLFWLTPSGAVCRRCGSFATDWADAVPPAGT